MNLRFLLLAALALALTAAPAPAQNSPPASRPAPKKPADDSPLKKANDDFDAAVARADFVAGEAAIRRVIELDKENFVPWYNLACMLSRQGKTKEACDALEHSLELGFADLRMLRADPDLANIRGTDTYKAILLGWDQILDSRLEAGIKAALKKYGKRYRVEKDENLRLAYVSAFDEATFAKSRAEIQMLATWWEENVAPLTPAGNPEAKTSRISWVMVLLPTREDYAEWASARYGENWEHVGGAYNDDDKKLVAQDLGPTLRHEFLHVLHWRDMNRRGQRQPFWVMEGLCSLVEDIEPAPGGSCRPLPSWRTNAAKTMEKNHSIAPWKVLFGRDQHAFVSVNPLANYAQARAVFLFLADQGKLKDWYAAYTANFGEDPTGLSAFEKAFGEPPERVEKKYHAWLRALPVTAETVTRGGASLPFMVEATTGDGMSIAELVADTSASKSGLKMRDVITSIAGTPVRDDSELVRCLATHEPGEQVEVTYRRGKLTGKAKITLVRAR